MAKTAQKHDKEMSDLKQDMTMAEKMAKERQDKIQASLDETQRNLDRVNEKAEKANKKHLEDMKTLNDSVLASQQKTF